MRSIFKTSNRAALAAMAAVYLLGSSAAALGAQTAPEGKTGAKKTSTSASVQTPPVAVAPFTNKFLSVFSSENARDPFNPQAKPKSSSAPVLTGLEGNLDQPQVLAAIQAGFQGIFGGTDERVVMVHGVLMPENRETTVLVDVGGKKRRLKVKAIKIYRNAAELQVEGLSQPVTVPKVQR